MYKIEDEEYTFIDTSTYTHVGITQDQQISPSDTVRSWFGTTVKVNGNYAIVGAPQTSSNTGCAYIFVKSETTWSQQAKLQSNDLASGDYFSNSVGIHGDYAIVGAPWDDDASSMSGSAYIFVRSGTTWSQQAKLVASDAFGNDRFGDKSDIHGNYAIVSGHLNDDAGNYSGSAYIFVRSGTTWTQQVKLLASDADENDAFGCDVAIDGDYAIVGAYKDNDGLIAGGDSGSAYIFVRSGTTWTQQAKLLASDPAASDYFGDTVDIHGDYAVVGAYGNDGYDGTSNSGSAYVFVRSGTTWSQQAKLVASDTQAQNFTRFDITIDKNCVVIGANGHDTASGISSAGCVYIFTRSGTTWTQRADLFASDQTTSNFFGRSANLSENNLLIGVNGHDGDGSNLGRVYAFTIPYATSTATRQIEKWDSNINLDVSGNIYFTGDIIKNGSVIDTTGAQGAQGQVGAQGPAGGAQGDAGATGYQGAQGPAGGAQGAQGAQGGAGFGYQGYQGAIGPQGAGFQGATGVTGYQGAVGATGFQGADGYVGSDGATGVTGAQGYQGVAGTFAGKGDTGSQGVQGPAGYVANTLPQKVFNIFNDNTVDASANNSGIVVKADTDKEFLYTFATGTQQQTDTDKPDWTNPSITKLVSSDPAPNSWDGYSVDVYGDWLINGAWQANGQDGKVSMYYKSGGTWSQHSVLTPSDPTTDNYFGYRTRLYGDYAVVAKYNQTNDPNVFVFHRTDSTWSQQAALIPSDTTNNSGLNQVDIYEEYIIAADRGQNTNRGAAFIFKRSGSTWSQQAKLLPSDTLSQNDFFGWGVAIYGEYAIVGSKDAQAAYIFHRTGTSWSQQAKFTGTSGQEYGRAVSIYGDTAMVGAQKANNTGAVYVYTRSGSTWSQQQVLVPSDSNATDSLFGGSNNDIAMYGDYAVIGASKHHPPGSTIDAGAIYIFKKVGTTWTQQSKVFPSDPATDDLFGHGTGMYKGDIVTGATLDDVAGSNAGASYVISTNTFGTTEVFGKNDHWGTNISIDVSGDIYFTGDLYKNGALINTGGAQGAQGAAGAQGSAGGAQGAAGATGYQGAQGPAGGAQGAQGAQGGAGFGYQGYQGFQGADGATGVTGAQGYQGVAGTFAGKGDTGSQGVQGPAGYVANTLPQKVFNIFNDNTVDASANNSGIVVKAASDKEFLYTLDEDTQVTDYSKPTFIGTIGQVKLTSSDRSADDEFGWSTSVHGDYFIVGARYDDDVVNNSGSAYIFKKTGGTWSQHTKLTASDPTNAKQFGYGVSIYGDYAVVGAIGHYGGAAYVFVNSGTTWTQQAKLLASDAASGDNFGSDVGIYESTIIVGAYKNDDGGTDSGSAYIFVRSDSSWSQQAKITAADAGAGDWFGSNVSIYGDSVVVGAWFESSQVGAAYVFTRTGTSWSQQAKLIGSDTLSNRRGYSVSIYDDYVMVGAYTDSSIVSNNGAAYVFKRTGTSWAQQAKITASDANELARFGTSVSIYQDYAVVGAYSETNAATEAGSAYLFKRSANGSSWTQQAKLLASDPEAKDMFGFNVSINQGHILVGSGAWAADYNNTSNPGDVYVYTSSTFGTKTGPALDKWSSNINLDVSGDIYFTGDLYKNGALINTGGAQGAQGSVGAQGPAGGAQGAAGATGAVGAQGPAGGAQGAQGAQGGAGFGYQGYQGYQGADGYVGSDGATGAQGAQGDEPIANEYTITVSSGKFYIDGTETPQLTLYKGFTYKFDQSASSNSSHPFYLSTTSDGTHGGGSQYTSGFTYSGTAGSDGEITFKVLNSAPATLYYCANHSGMGGSISISIIETGAQGATGAQGFQGADGYVGSDGATGVTLVLKGSKVLMAMLVLMVHKGLLVLKGSKVRKVQLVLMVLLVVIKQ